MQCSATLFNKYLTIPCKKCPICYRLNFFFKKPIPRSPVTMRRTLPGSGAWKLLTLLAYDIPNKLKQTMSVNKKTLTILSIIRPPYSIPLNFQNAIHMLNCNKLTSKENTEKHVSNLPQCKLFQ